MVLGGFFIWSGARIGYGADCKSVLCGFKSHPDLQQQKGITMRAWIYTSDLDNYMQLMRSEGSDPSVISQTDDQSHVEMTASVAGEWNMLGLWYQLG